jgi:hypothetical protein
MTDGCNCGCGKDRDTVVREIARTENLNYDQADARLDAANAMRVKLGKAKP